MKAQLLSLYEHTVLGRPRATLAILAVILTGFLSGLGQFKIDASTEVLFREGDEDLRTFIEMTMRYSTPEFLFIAVEPPDDLVSDSNLQLISDLRDEISDIPQVLDVVSILDIPLLYSMPGEAFDVWFNLRTLRLPEIDRDLAREELTTSALYQDFFASSDGKVTGIAIALNPHPDLPRMRTIRDELLFKRMTTGIDPQQELELERMREPFEIARDEAAAETHEAIVQIRGVIANHQGDARLYFGGLPMITHDVISYIGRDLVMFGAGVFAFLIVMLTVIFREVRWVALPFASCIYASVVMIGLLGLLGWSVTVVSSNFVALMLIITMSMNIHLVVRYRELFRDHPQASQFELVSLTVQHMAQPCFFTAITTITAFSSLVLSEIQPVIDFGWMMTISLGGGYLLPHSPCFAGVAGFDEKIRTGSRRSRAFPAHCHVGPFHREARGVGADLSRPPSALPASPAPSVWKLSKVSSRISTRTPRIYQGLKLIDESLGGTTPLEILLRFPTSSGRCGFGLYDR